MGRMKLWQSLFSLLNGSPGKQVFLMENALKRFQKSLLSPSPRGRWLSCLCTRLSGGFPGSKTQKSMRDRLGLQAPQKFLTLMAVHRASINWPKLPSCFFQFIVTEVMTSKLLPVRAEMGGLLYLPKPLVSSFVKRGLIEVSLTQICLKD